jgi:hypothetical protein
MMIIMNFYLANLASIIVSIPATASILAASNALGAVGMQAS